MEPEPTGHPDFDTLLRGLPAYEIDAYIAAGGMGVVYRARQVSLDRTVALKILPRELGSVPGFRESFLTEARAMAKLNHPNLIAVFDCGEVDDLPYIAMEYVHGESLFASANGKAIDPETAVGIILKISAGLAHAHAAGIIHRDIKPANILLNLQAEPKIGDFGLACGAEASPELCMGTPGYVAPEVVNRPDTADKRSDIFAVGAILHELLTGMLPEAAAGRPPSALAKVDAGMDRIVKTATHPDPDRRYQEIDGMVRDLKDWSQHHGRKLAVPAAPNPAAKRPAAVPYAAPRSSAPNMALRIAIIAFLLAAIGLVWNIREGRKQEIRQSLSSNTTPAEPNVSKVTAPATTNGPDEAYVPHDDPAGTAEENTAAEIPRSSGTGVPEPSRLPVGIWRPEKDPANLRTFLADKTCTSLRGDSGTWTWTPSSEGGTWETRWKSGTIDTALITSDGIRASGSNNQGAEINFAKLPEYPELPEAKFMGHWTNRDDPALGWVIEPGGIAYGIRYSEGTRSTPTSKTKCSWRRGPVGNQILVFWDGNQRWFNILSYRIGADVLDLVNQRNERGRLMRADDLDRIAGNNTTDQAQTVSLTASQAAGPGTVRDLAYWKNKAMEDFPALRDKNSRMNAKVLALRKQKETISPSLLERADWPYQLATEAALYFNDANPQHLDAGALVFRGRFYKVILEKCSWHEAEQRCRDMRGRLVAIPDQDTQDFVAKLAASRELWIGATEEVQEGVWVWSDGRKTNPDRLGKGEGNNGSDEDYLAIRQDGKWGDWPLNARLDGFICEWWKADEDKAVGNAEAEKQKEQETRWMTEALSLCGEWKTGNDPNHYFIRQDRTTTHGRDKGTWKIVDGVMKVSWENGFSADIELRGQRNSLDWLGFRPGRTNPTVKKFTRVK